MENILACYREKYPHSYIWTASKQIPVYWGHYSIVQAEFNCLLDLFNNSLKVGKPWVYALNLAGSEIMTYTNKELGNLPCKKDVIFLFQFQLAF